MNSAIDNLSLKSTIHRLVGFLLINREYVTRQKGIRYINGLSEGHGLVNHPSLKLKPTPERRHH